MRSICPLSVCSSGEYVYVTAEPISLPPSPLFRPSSPVIFPSVPRRPPSYPPPIGYCSFSSLCIPATSPLRPRYVNVPSSLCPSFLRPSEAATCAILSVWSQPGMSGPAGLLNVSYRDFPVSLQRSASLPASCLLRQLYPRRYYSSRRFPPPGASPSAAL